MGLQTETNEELRGQLFPKNTNKVAVKAKAKELLKTFTLYLGDDGALGEYWTDKLEAKRNVSLAIAEIYKLPLKIGQYLDNEENIEMYYAFWEDVKEELEKL